MEWPGVVLVALVMLVGVVGTLLPVLPGVPLVWAAGLGYGLVDGFGRVGTVAFTVMTLLAVAGVAAGIVLPARRGAASGAPRSTLVAGGLGGIVGFFVIPVVGIVIGAVAGVYLAEQARLGDTAAAWRTTKSVLVGFGLGALAELVAALAMVGCWVAWVVAG